MTGRNAWSSIAVLCVVVLGGCAPAPERPVDQGEQFSFRAPLTPYSAAICIARNAKARGVGGEERTFGESGMEVVVRALSGSGGTLAVARILRDGTFSNVTILVTRLVSSDRGGFAHSLMSGC